MEKKKLTDEERNFFRQVTETIYTNPFSVSRESIEQRFPETIHDKKTRTQHHFSAVAGPLEQRLLKLKNRGISRLGDLAEDDGDLFRHEFLFWSYHQCVEPFDAHIEAQLSNQEPIAVPFAEPVIRELIARGLGTSEANRYFGLFFQLRRAYYFIDRALVGTSPSMAELRRALWTCVFTDDVGIYDAYLWNRMEDFSTLLLGETGTGKGAAAAAIGRSGYIPFHAGQRRFAESFNDTFTATNLSQFPESLIESELFGHCKGAFTGAVDNHKGLFERCSAHGSLFLDEIGEVTTATQIKLLKILQERLFTPVGSHKERRFSGRVIAATNRTLGELRENGFRDDFFYRLSSLIVTVPPLRQRIAESETELTGLVALVIERMVGEPAPDLAQRVLSVVRRDVPKDYPWPGNVRELEQVIRRVLLSQQCRPSKQPSIEDLGEAMVRGEMTAHQLLSRYCLLLYRQSGNFEEVGRRTGLDRRTVRKYVKAVEES